MTVHVKTSHCAQQYRDDPVTLAQLLRHLKPWVRHTLTGGVK